MTQHISDVGQELHDQKDVGLITEWGVGDVPSTLSDYIEVIERGDGYNHQTVLKLTDCPLSIVAGSDANGAGGLKVYDFPLTRILLEAVSAQLSVGVETQADFTDGTPEGDIGIGSAAPADADALGTDDTDDDYVTASVAFTMADYKDTDVALAPAAAAIAIDGRAAAKPVYLNGLVDNADIDSSVTTNLLVSGTIWITWKSLGGGSV